MLDSLEQATQTQNRRVKSGKKGTAKAVRRFFKRGRFKKGAPWNCYNLEANFEGCKPYDWRNKPNEH